MFIDHLFEKVAKIVDPEDKLPGSEIIKLVEEKFTSTNKPSAKCYSIECPAIWFDKCTSSKYSECLDNQVE